MPRPLLEARGVAARLGEHRFPEVSLALESGDLVWVKGASGSGKSTLLRALARLVYSSGYIFFEGRAASHIPAPRWRRQVRYLGARPALGRGTVGDALARPFTFSSGEGAFDAEAARSELATLGLEGLSMDAELHTLSSGQLQRVALARALLRPPAVLLADETCSHLDPEATARVFRRLEGALEVGTGIIWVSHRDEAPRAARTVLELES